MTLLDILKMVVPFLLGTSYSVFNNISQKKESNRAFPYVEEAYFPIDLKEIKVKENTRLYMSGDYSKLARDEKVDNQAKIIYLKVTNLGPGHMINCDFNIKTSSTDLTTEWDFKVHVPIIRKDEVILIPTVKESMSNIRLSTKSVNINYLTHSQEEMEYNQKLEKVNKDSTLIKDSLHVNKSKNKFLKFFRRSKVLYEYEGKNSLFTYLDAKKEKK
ncbi:hypothetical protein F6Y05_33520 (plasmid) [Bacillus megaterium]|nr:hypothetical protein [Priestia megaterium]